MSKKSTQKKQRDSAPPFDHLGEFSLEFNKYNLSKAILAVNEGLKANEADFGWRTFAAARPDLVAAVKEKHPGPSDDTQKTVRYNFHKQVKNFNKWLKTGEGMTSCFVCCCHFVCHSHLPLLQ